MRRIIIFLAALIGGPALIICGIGEYKDSKQLQAHGKTITAEVTKAEETVSRKGRHKYWLTIQFQPEQGGAQTAKSQVSSDRFNRAVTEKSIGIVYLPSNPQVFQFGDKAETRYGSIVAGSILSVGALGFLAYLLLARRSSKQRPDDASQGPLTLPAAVPPMANDPGKAA